MFKFSKIAKRNSIYQLASDHVHFPLFIESIFEAIKFHYKQENDYNDLWRKLRQDLSDDWNRYLSLWKQLIPIRIKRAKQIKIFPRYASININFLRKNKEHKLQIFLLNIAFVILEFLHFIVMYLLYPLFVYGWLLTGSLLCTICIWMIIFFKILVYEITK